jgi:hypothetical protein
MKRSITMSVGALVLSQFLASTVLAEPKCFTTGPLENAAERSSTSFWVKVLNNNSNDAVKANVVAFNLNGQKTPINIGVPEFEVAPLSSSYIVIEGLGVEFTVEVQVDNGEPVTSNTLLGGFGKDASGNLVSAHRLVHSEWTRITCEAFGSTCTWGSQNPHCATVK